MTAKVVTRMEIAAGKVLGQCECDRQADHAAHARPTQDERQPDDHGSGKTLA